MASTKLPFLVFVLAILAVDGAHRGSHHAPSPSPSPTESESVDCSSLVLKMSDCLSFVSNGSSVTKPEGTCCSGLKTVLKADAECLCEALKSSAQLGVVLNTTKAMTLPAACKLSAPSASNCKLSASPAAAPAQSPLSIAAAPVENDIAPAPATGNSGSSLVWISVGNMVIGFIVAYFCGF